MKTIYKVITATVLTAVVLSFQNCAVVRPGQIGFRQRLGKLKDKPLTEGMKFVNPFTTRIIKLSTAIRDYSLTLPLPSKEGLEISADVTLLYHIKRDSAYSIYVRIGREYEKRIVITNFNAIAREVCVRFYARDLITQKDSLEISIAKKLSPILNSYGITVDQIIIRDIDLPDEIVQAIKRKVTAEQTALQVAVDIDTKRKEFEFDLEKQKAQEDFNIEKQKKEAERTLIEAEATKAANDSINQSLSDRILKLRSIEATKEMFQSPNAKLIITDGRSPITIHAEGGETMGTK